MLDITLKINRENQAWKWLESQTNSLITSGHIGTHIDVYKKTEIPESYFESKGIIIDCKSYAINDEIGMEVVENQNIEKGSFVMFQTNMMKKYPYGSVEYIKSHYQLSEELIDYLIAKKVYFIGIDFAGVRRGKEHYSADVKCEDKGVYVVENLDLRKIDDISKPFKVYTAWINNPLATGFATRVFIEFKE